MRLEQVTTVNWGHLPICDVRFGNVTLLGGESGSGKTSLIDAVIAVMTGNERRFAKYNAAQSEMHSSKKSRRDLASYVLGADDSGVPHRPHGAHGYAAIYWEPDGKDGALGKPFTAIIGVEARHDRLAGQSQFRVHEEVRILVFGHRITTRDLVVTTSGGEQIVPVQELLVSLRKSYGKEAVRDFSTKAEYVCRLYGTLKGFTTSVDRREAEGCMRAFVNSIAYRQPDDLDALIREEILEADDNARMIETLKTTITDIANLRQQADRLEANVRLLEMAKGHLDESRKAFVEEWMFVALAASRTLADAIGRRDAAMAAGKVAAEQLDEASLEIKRCERIVATRGEALARLRQQIEASDTRRIRDGLEREIADGEAAISAFEKMLGSAGAQLIEARSAVRQAVNATAGSDDLRGAAEKLGDIAERIDSIRFAEVQGHCLAVRDGVGTDALTALQSSMEAIDAAIGVGWVGTFAGEGSVANAFDLSRDQLRASKSVLQTERRECEARRRALAAGHVLYPPEVTQFLAHIREILPEARPRILCDVVEIKEPKWQNAIEGFIGRDRFAILYEPNFEARVIALLRTYGRGGQGRPSVAQIGEALKEARAAVTGSLVDKIKSDDEIAIGYLIARFGRSLCVANEEELRTVRSGLLQDGVSVHAFNYRNRSESDDRLVFGMEVRRRQAKALSERIVSLDQDILELATKEEALKVAGVSLARFRPASLEGLEPERLQTAGTIVRRARRDLEQLDVSDIAELERQAEDERQAVAEATHAMKGQLLEAGRLQSVLSDAEKKVNEQNQEIEKLEPACARTTRDWTDALTALNEAEREPHEAAFQQEIATTRPVKSFEDRRGDRRSTAQGCKADLESALREYNRDAFEHQKITVHPLIYPAPAPSPMAQWLTAMAEQVGRQLRIQKETGLVEQRGKLVLAEQTFSTAFTSNFCLRILQKVTGPDRTIEVIKASLQNISFAGDTLSITQILRDEYARYLDLFRVVRQKAEAGQADLFDKADFGPAEKETLDELKRLLLSDDVDHAMKELYRIADYRNYKKYDFSKSTKGGEAIGLSSWGTGSGGEAETPFYIIRAAVFAASFRLFAKQASAHFRTVFLDEVFQKMDETRTRRVLSFLVNDMGLQVVCASPTKSMAALMDVFDKRISFAKSGTAGAQSWIDEADLDQERVKAIYEQHRRGTIEKTTALFDRTHPVGIKATAAE